MYLGPLYVGLMAWAALGEAPQGYHLLGTPLVLPGLFLAPRRPVRAHKEPDMQHPASPSRVFVLRLACSPSFA